MKNAQARRIKWDIVDHLLCQVHMDDGAHWMADWTPEERRYAVEQVERIARVLNVTDHMYL